MTFFKRLAAISVSLFSMGAAPAFASSWLECDGDSGKKIKWGGSSTTARINTGSFSGATLDAVRRGIDAVNRNPSPFSIRATTETGGVGSGNGQNEIYGSSIDPPGVARMRYHCYWFFGWHHGLDEVDIVLDTTGPSWTSSQNKADIFAYTGTLSPIDAVITHEAGHYLGLMHVSAEYNIMGDSWRHHVTNGATASTYFGEDASRGSRILYGAQSSAFNDVGVSHWRRTGESGEYSSHGRTRIRNQTDTSDLPTVTVNGETGYRVSRNLVVQAEFTIENNGKADVNNVRYGMYLSTNDTISTADRRLGGGSFGTINPSDPSTQRLQVTIPADAALNTNYWLGMIIDDNDTVSEVTGSNNAAYIPIRVQ